MLTPGREAAGMGEEDSPLASASPPGAERQAAGASEQQAAGASERRAAGALEAEILAILREADGPLSPGEVRERLAQRQPGGSPPSSETPADGPRGELSY